MRNIALAKHNVRDVTKCRLARCRNSLCNTYLMRSRYMADEHSRKRMQSGRKWVFISESL